ncbi:hypothetical protein FKP32DRAFT_1591476 [Trametes sanguinea]|nr:hypothetical protein FKP32DRAFT_1591476 [Trametes sanguinea]
MASSSRSPSTCPTASVLTRAKYLERLCPIAPPVPVPSNPYGPLLLGTFIGLILYGLAVNQSTNYFYRFPTDKRYLKAFVEIILFVETLHSALIVHWCYITLVSKYGHPEALMFTTWSMNLFLVSTGLVVTITQLYVPRQLENRRRGCTHGVPVSFYSYRVLLSKRGRHQS